MKQRSPVSYGLRKIPLDRVPKRGACGIGSLGDEKEHDSVEPTGGRVLEYKGQGQAELNVRSKYKRPAQGTREVCSQCKQT